MLQEVKMTKERYEEVMRIWKSIPDDKLQEIGQFEWDNEKLAEALKPYGLTTDEWFVAVY